MEVIFEFKYKKTSNFLEVLKMVAEEGIEPPTHGL